MDGASNVTLKTPAKNNYVGRSVQAIGKVGDSAQKPVLLDGRQRTSSTSTPTPMKPTQGGKGNHNTTPKTAMKLRREGGFPKTARELKQRVQKMRSPRSALQSISVNTK
jgi:hypothetical protein